MSKSTKNALTRSGDYSDDNGDVLEIVPRTWNSVERSNER